jgi:hypothetical protein
MNLNRSVVILFAFASLVVTTFDLGNLSLRTDRWRYIRYADGSEELYDLHKDPHEWDNLADSTDHAETKRQLSETLNRRIRSLEATE